MIVTREEARRIASLARLEMDDATLDRMAGEMTRILDYIDQLREVDTSAAGEIDAPSATWRSDTPGRTAAVEAIATNAPAWRDGLFVVPKVIASE